MVESESSQNNWHRWRTVLVIVAVVAFALVVAFLAYQVIRPLKVASGDYPIASTTVVTKV